MRKLLVEDIKKGIHGKRELWEVHCRDEADEVHIHFFPDVALEWRAAEYGIDPGEVETLLDIILHEVFIPDVTQLVNAEEDPAAKAGMFGEAVGSEAHAFLSQQKIMPVHLYNTTNVDKAREAHLMRIEHAKKNVGAFVKHPDKKSDPFKKFADEYEMDNQLIERAGKLVSRTRKGLVEKAKQERLSARALRAAPKPHQKKYDEYFKKQGIE